MTTRATREAFGETLVELAQAGVDVYAVDADLSGSTTTKKLGDFDAKRLVNVGIAEQNMINVAAGLAFVGKTAYTASFAVFGTGRCYDQIRNTVCYANLNVKICPTHAGISVGPDGGSHQMLEDMNLMRGLPNMRVICPADYTAARSAIKLAAELEGPVYVRLGRAKVPVVYDETFDAQVGKAHVLREGSDVTLVACGVEVNEALIAANLLEQEGIDVEVIDAFFIKPLDVDTILASACKTGRVITAEEHSIYGGLGSAVAEALSEHYPCPCVRVGVQDSFGTSAEFEELLTHFKLDAASIAERVRALVQR